MRTRSLLFASSQTFDCEFADISLAVQFDVGEPSGPRPYGHILGDIDLPCCGPGHV